MSRVFSGIRPSGRLHLGNYLGAIKNWIALQTKHECIFAIVDYHAITTPFSPEELRENVREVALDYLAVGLDPKRATLMIQSQVPEHLELGWIFASGSPLSWFEKIPTYKDKIAQHPDHVNLGLLSYPALMAADILIYKAELVPVGEDQVPHIEMTNKIGRKFNRDFGKTFPEVKVLLTEGARIMSLKDPHKKMSKTGDEGVALSDSPEEVRQKLKTAVTDSGREIVAREDKPALTNLLTIYSEVSGLPISKLEKQYAGKGYAEFKDDLAEAVVKFLEPIQKRRRELEKKRGYVEEVLAHGAAKARPLAQKTLTEVKKRMGLL
ncbi:tryptophan--tRNA ligase [Candidatus Uhrbacteria bacterium]|nr:tryptophan--tRNA ligase [Candidatus Uhrbacteria bacterium]